MTKLEETYDVLDKENIEVNNVPQKRKCFYY